MNQRHVTLPGVASLFTAIGLTMAGCAGIGPAAISTGRPAYNNVINETEDQQVLSMIVRQRYDESFGMLAVSSVTASLRFGASAEGNIGIGPRSGYEGNLVPLSVGAVYEDNPTISYVPLRGEKFMERMLAPVTPRQTFLLARLSDEDVDVLRLLVRRINGVVNPLYGLSKDQTEFDRFIAHYSRLRDDGRLDVVQTAEGQFQLYIHDFRDDSERVASLLHAIGLREPAAENDTVSLPLRFGVGSPQQDAVDIETPSALEVLEAAGLGIDVPEPHRAAGFVRRPAVAGRWIVVRSSQERPSSAAVSTWHRGWWFFIENDDTRSKRAFVVLRTLVGLLLDESASDQPAPVLTVPVSR